MKTNYPLGDFLIRLKNSAMAKNKEVDFLANKKILAVAESLKKLGFIEKIEKEKITLTFKNKMPVLMGLKLKSKPGLRVYINTWDLTKKKTPSIYLISTPRGVMSSKEALKQKLGGEVIAEVW